MAVTLINNFGVGTTDFTAMMATINKSYKGKSEITLSNYDNDTAPAVKVGSVFDCNGAIYLVETADETPSGYPGITNDTMFYLIFDVSALAFEYTSTAPTWSDSNQGWYNGNDRYFFSMYKDSGGTLYHGKKQFINNPTFYSITGSHTDAEAYAIIDQYFTAPTEVGVFKRQTLNGFIQHTIAISISRGQATPLEFTIGRSAASGYLITSTGTTVRTWDLVSSSGISIE